MSNPANSGTVIGRLAAKPRLMGHKNGTSGTMLLTLYAQDNFVTKSTGKRESVRIDLEDFIADVTKVGAYAYMEEGSLIALRYELRNSDHRDANGNMVYGMKAVVERGSIQLLESRSAVAARRGRKQAQAQPAQQGQGAPAQGQAVQAQMQNQAVQNQPAQQNGYPVQGQVQGQNAPAPQPFDTNQIQPQQAPLSAGDPYNQVWG